MMGCIGAAVRSCGDARHLASKPELLYELDIPGDSSLDLIVQDGIRQTQVIETIRNIVLAGHLARDRRD
jgi:hypothetical protein